MTTAFANATASHEASHAQFPFVPNVVSIRTGRQMRQLPGTKTEADPTLTFEARPADEELSESKGTVVHLKVNQIRCEMNLDQIVGNSSALREVLELAEKVASWESTVLLLGETGTGKELVAQAIHRHSDRSHRALIKVNCAALPSELVASELFGHEKGAFTGALQQRIGRFEAANGGTIFLDEIAELSPEIQVALLRVLQEREFERVGGNRTIKTNVRVIAATNKDLQHEVSVGRFRMDLFYRLNVFPIRMPALRERLEDIPLLVDHFTGRLAGRMGKKITQIERRSLSAMQQYSWPGNVRELQNVIERSVILADGEVLRIDPGMLVHEPPPCISATAAAESGSGGSDRKARIEAVLRETRGKVYGPNGAAVRLHISGTTLDSQILALGIKKYQFK
jgi:formate hydrogenlyase transcriptional activator